MLDLTEKLNLYTATVLSDAAAETEKMLAALDAKRQAALTEAENATLLEAYQYVKAEAARVRGEAGRTVSRHMLENQQALYLRREEIAHEVFEQVRERIVSFTKTSAYSARLVALFSECLSHLEPHSSVKLYLRPCDMAFSEALMSVAGGIRSEVLEGDFTLGGLIIECPAKNLRFDATFDSAMAELDGHFAELFGLSLANDDPADSPGVPFER